jgi:thiol-disulfide isomerase/thioredoxin
MKALYKSTFFRVIALVFISSMMSCEVETPPSTPPPPATVVVTPPPPPPVVTPPPPPPVITEPIPPNGIYTTRIIVEKHTGTWCGHCPRLSKKLDDAVKKYPNIISVAVHNGDMSSQYSSDLEGINKVTGFPTGMINRTTKWNEAPEAFTAHLDFKRTIGISIESVIDDKNNISGKVRVHNGKDYTEDYKLNIILVEDKLYYDQSNYGYNNEPNPIVKKEHNDVLRAYSTKVVGDEIPATNKKVGNVYEKTFSFDAKGFDTKNCKIIAYVSESKSGIINANKVEAGKTKVAD